MTTALLVIDHGSKRKAANDMLLEVVESLRKQRPGLIVFGAHMELAAPTIEDGVNYCVEKGATHIVAHPYMLSPGRHAVEDIPELVKGVLLTHPHVTYAVTGPLGLDDLLVELVLKRASL